MTTDEAIAELRRVSPTDEPWIGDDFSGGQQDHDPEPIDHAIAAILNAVIDGSRVVKLIADAEARGMDRAAGIAKRFYEKALHRADAASKDGAADDELEATASAYGSIEHAIRAEAAAIRRAAEGTAT